MVVDERRHIVVGFIGRRRQVKNVVVGFKTVGDVIAVRVVEAIHGSTGGGRSRSQVVRQVGWELGAFILVAAEAADDALAPRAINDYSRGQRGPRMASFANADADEGGVASGGPRQG